MVRFILNFTGVLFRHQSMKNAFTMQGYSSFIYKTISPKDFITFLKCFIAYQCGTEMAAQSSSVDTNVVLDPINAESIDC